MARGNNGQPIFKNNNDYSFFIEMLRKTKERYPFKLYAYALMPNHVHLLIEVLENPTAVIMQSVLTGYARCFNIRHKRIGHLFQGRYKAIVCQKDVYLMILMSYIHLNPVRAKLVKSPMEWQWSGHREYVGSVEKPLIDHGVANELFGKGVDGCNNYNRYINEGLGINYIDDLHPAENNPFLGSDKFVDGFIEKEPCLAPKKSIEALAAKVAKKFNVSVKAVRGDSSERNVTQARREIIKIAVVEYEHGGSAVAKYLHCDPSYVTRVLQRISQICQV